MLQVLFADTNILKEMEKKNAFKLEREIKYGAGGEREPVHEQPNVIPCNFPRETSLTRKLSVTGP